MRDRHLLLAGAAAAGFVAAAAAALYYAYFSENDSNGMSPSSSALGGEPQQDTGHAEASSSGASESSLQEMAMIKPVQASASNGAAAQTLKESTASPYSTTAQKQQLHQQQADGCEGSLLLQQSSGSQVCDVEGSIPAAAVAAAVASSSSAAAPAPPTPPSSSKPQQHSSSLTDNAAVTPLSDDGSLSPRNITSPRSSSSSSKQRLFNTTRHRPSIDNAIAESAVARSLQVQYAEEAAEQAAVPRRSLPTWCSLLAELHCKKLQDIHGDMGETTALDIGCGTGGSCFQLALSFSHVLGLDGDQMLVAAAKEMKEKGQLQYHPVAEHQQPASKAGVTAAASAAASSAEELQLDVTCLARVSDDIDRDKVRFWNYALPDLPPKLQPVDAVLVEDVEQRLGAGLRKVLQQVPALLNPDGVCVVVLRGNSSSSSSSSSSSGGGGEASCESENIGATMEDVKQWLEQQGLQFVKQQPLQYPVSGSTELHAAVAGVWLLPGS